MTELARLQKKYDIAEKQHAKMVQKLTAASRISLLIPQMTEKATALATEKLRLKAMIDAGSKVGEMEVPAFLNKQQS